MTGGLYEERQFIIVPGEVNVRVANSTDWYECNRGTKVHVFDTFDWEFKSEFNPDNRGPKVPPSIVKQIGGNESGGATLTGPTSWDDPTLGLIFAARNELPSESLATVSPVAPPEITVYPTSSDNTDPSSKDQGIIVGGAIGGFCVVALVVGVFIFFWKRRRVSESKAGLQEDHLGDMQQTDSIVELHGFDLRAELPGNYNDPNPGNTPHVFHAYQT